MSRVLPEHAKQWIDGTSAFATIITIEPDGRPHGSVMWLKRDGDDLIFSTVKGRRKHSNILADPRVTVVVYPLEDPYSYVEVRGTASISETGGHELIEELCWKYMGHGIDDFQHGRVVIRIKADKVVFHPSRALRATLTP